MEAILDMDIVCWRAGFAAQSSVYDIYKDGTRVEDSFTKAMCDMYVLDDDANEYEVVERVVPSDWTVAKFFCDNLIKSIVKGSGASSYIGYIGGTRNFRKEINPDYKNNRKGLQKPYWINKLREHILNNHNVIIVDGIEADDAMAIRHSSTQSRTILCTIDKDLKQVPGKYYHIVNKDIIDITQREGDLFLYSQMLVGDVADNVEGIKGIGPKKAEKLLEPCKDISEMQEAVLDKYIETYGLEDGQDKYDMNFNMLYILRTQDEADERTSNIWQ